MREREWLGEKKAVGVESAALCVKVGWDTMERRLLLMHSVHPSLVAVTVVSVLRC